MKMRLFMAFVAMVGLAQAGDFDALRWRNLGPNRGGRSLAVAGSVKRPLEYYFGAVGGGLWKQVFATLLAFGFFFSVVGIAALVRSRWFRHLRRATA